MKRRPSKRIFAAFIVVFFGLFIAAGFLSGAGGLSKAEALVVISAITVVAIPALILVAPESFLKKPGR